MRHGITFVSILILTMAGFGSAYATSDKNAGVSLLKIQIEESTVLERGSYPARRLARTARMVTRRN